MPPRPCPLQLRPPPPPLSRGPTLSLSLTLAPELDRVVHRPCAPPRRRHGSPRRQLADQQHHQGGAWGSAGQGPSKTGLDYLRLLVAVADASICTSIYRGWSRHRRWRPSRLHSLTCKLVHPDDLPILKWSKGKQKEKVNNAVLFDKATYDKLISEVPKYKQITPSVLSERLRQHHLQRRDPNHQFRRMLSSSQHLTNLAPIFLPSLMPPERTQLTSRFSAMDDLEHKLNDIEASTR